MDRRIGVVRDSRYCQREARAKQSIYHQDLRGSIFEKFSNRSHQLSLLMTVDEQAMDRQHRAEENFMPTKNSTRRFSNRSHRLHHLNTVASGLVPDVALRRALLHDRPKARK